MSITEIKERLRDDGFPLFVNNCHGEKVNLASKVHRALKEGRIVWTKEKIVIVSLDSTENFTVRSDNG